MEYVLCVHDAYDGHINKQRVIDDFLDAFDFEYSGKGMMGDKSKINNKLSDIERNQLINLMSEEIDFVYTPGPSGSLDDFITFENLDSEAFEAIISYFNGHTSVVQESETITDNIVPFVKSIESPKNPKNSGENFSINNQSKNSKDSPIEEDQT